MHCPLPAVEASHRIPLSLYEALKREDATAAEKYTPITHIDIFDFDGTLFHSPNPNLALWKQVEEALGDTSAPTSAKKKHKLLVEKVADGGLGWYQSIETLLPPLVTTDPADSSDAHHHTPSQLSEKAPQAHLVAKTQNYFTEADRDVLCCPGECADFIFSDRVILEEKCPRKRRHSPYTPHPRALFHKATLENFINPDVFRELRASAADPTHLTIILTGRNVLFTRIVHEIVHTFGISVDDIKMKPLVIPFDKKPSALSAANALEDVVQEGACNPITTLGIKEEYITKMLTYYASPMAALRDGLPESASEQQPHVRMFEDRQPHILKFERLLEGLRDRPLEVRFGCAARGFSTDSDAPRFGAHIDSPQTKFLVERFWLIPEMYRTAPEIVTEEISQFPQNHPIRNKAKSPFSVRRNFSFEVIHVQETGESLPMHIEFAVISHLQSVHNTVLFDLCALCCMPKGMPEGFAETADGASRTPTCACDTSKAPKENPFVQKIASSRDAFIRDLSGGSRKE